MGPTAPGVQMNREHRSGVGFGDRDPRLRARMTAAQAQLTLDAGQRLGDADQKAAKRDQVASYPDRTAFTLARDQWTKSAPARGTGAHTMVVAVDVRPPAPAPQRPAGPICGSGPQARSGPLAHPDHRCPRCCRGRSPGIGPRLQFALRDPALDPPDHRRGRRHPRRPWPARGDIGQPVGEFSLLAGFFKVALGGFADGAITYSVIGVVALIWGAGRFHQSLDDAMARARFHVTQLAATCCSSRGWRKWSGRRGSNPRHSAWEADTLPTELLPLGRPWGFTPCAEECTTRRAPHATDGERGTGARSCRRSPS